MARFTYGLVLLAGVGLGCLAVILGTGSPAPVQAASNDRYGDFAWRPLDGSAESQVLACRIPRRKSAR